MSQFMPQDSASNHIPLDPVEQRHADQAPADAAFDFDSDDEDQDYDLDPPAVMRMTQSVYGQLLDLEYLNIERGGMLIGPSESDIVTNFVEDLHAHASSSHFQVNSKTFNPILSRYSGLGLNAKGMAHCHPPFCTSPSSQDLRYVRKSLGNPKNKSCGTYLLPIICDGVVWPYMVYRESFQVVLAELVLV